MGIHTAMHNWKCFPCAVVTQNTRKEGREQGRKTWLLILVQQKNKIKDHKETTIVIIKVFESKLQEGDSGLTYLAYWTANISENTGHVTDPSNCHDECNKIFSIANGNFLHQYLEASLDEVINTSEWIRRSNGKMHRPPYLIHCWSYILIWWRRKSMNRPRPHHTENTWKNSSGYVCFVQQLRKYLLKEEKRVSVSQMLGQQIRFEETFIRRGFYDAGPNIFWKSFRNCTGFFCAWDLLRSCMGVM